MMLISRWLTDVCSECDCAPRLSIKLSLFYQGFYSSSLSFLGETYLLKYFKCRLPAAKHPPTVRMFYIIPHECGRRHSYQMTVSDVRADQHRSDWWRTNNPRVNSFHPPPRLCIRQQYSMWIWCGPTWLSKPLSTEHVDNVLSFLDSKT